LTKIIFRTWILITEKTMWKILLYFPSHSMFDLLWTRWQWDWVFSEYIFFSLALSFHQCSLFYLLTTCQTMWAIGSIIK
jgi:hypothetical protein